MFTLTTDTSCDVARNKLDEAGIPWIPITFIIDGVSYPDDYTSDEQYKEFYAKVRSGVMPSTSQISIFAHEEFFEKVVAGGATDIVHLSLSGGLSATYDNACKAAQSVMEKHPDVTINVVDTQGATQVHHMVLDDAVKLRDEGKSGSEAAEILRAETDKIHVWIIVDDLMHLKRGGRVSGAAAAIGTLLNIKPMIVFNKKGELKVAHKAKGFRKAIDYVCDYIDEWAPDVKEIYMANADADEKIEEAAKALTEKFNCKVTKGWVGPVIGAHTGPGMIGILFKSDKVRPVE